MARAAKSNTAKSESICPLTNQPRLRLASEEQTASIKDNFPPGIAQPALRALFAAGLTDLKKLSRVSEAELSELHGMGPKAVGLLREALIANGLNFRSSAKR